MTGLFEHAMRHMRSHNPQTQEDGFRELLSHTGEYVDDLINEFRHEQRSRGLRCWLLELIGEARSPQALRLLVEQLQGDDEALRSWAAHGLELLDTKEARQALYQARGGGVGGEPVDRPTT